MSDEIFFAVVAFPQGAVDNNLQQFLFATLGNRVAWKLKKQIIRIENEDGIAV